MELKDGMAMALAFFAPLSFILAIALVASMNRIGDLQTRLEELGWKIDGLETEIAWYDAEDDAHVKRLGECYDKIIAFKKQVKDLKLRLANIEHISSGFEADEDDH